MTTENLLKVSRERTDKLKDKIARLEWQNKEMREALDLLLQQQTAIKKNHCGQFIECQRCESAAVFVPILM